MKSNLFYNIKGQDKAKDFLSKAWKNHRLSSSLLFYGPDSVGKKLTAYALSQALLCTSSNKDADLLSAACGHCTSCKEVKEKRSPYVLEIQPVNNSIKVEQSTEVVSFLNLKVESNARIIIIDEAQYLNVQSSNKLLKTLEELSENNYIILLSPSVKSLLSTISSRLSKIAFCSLKKNVFFSIIKEEPTELNFFNYNLKDYKKWNEILEDQALKESINFWTLFLKKDKKLFSFISKNLSKKDKIETFIYISKTLLLDKIKLNTLRVSQLNELFSSFAAENCIYLLDLLLNLEKDIKNNINPLLSLENFCIQAIK
ncbi:MAG: AAA family ATPase [Bdellovibrionaceae bacterium]|nr:AAA family ATPase [Pseudobdellovibrionaceae bacterium]